MDRDTHVYIFHMYICVSYVGVYIYICIYQYNIYIYIYIHTYIVLISMYMYIYVHKHGLKGHLTCPKHFKKLEAAAVRMGIHWRTWPYEIEQPGVWV